MQRFNLFCGKNLVQPMGSQQKACALNTPF